MAVGEKGAETGVQRRAERASPIPKTKDHPPGVFLYFEVVVAGTSTSVVGWWADAQGFVGQATVVGCTPFPVAG